LGDLDRMFNPKSIAVIGASRNPKKIGYELVSNILAGGYEGRLYPVNTEGAEIMGMKSYTSIMEVPGEVDLAVIAVPAVYVPDIMEECGKKGIKTALVDKLGLQGDGQRGARVEAAVDRQRRTASGCSAQTSSACITRHRG